MMLSFDVFYCSLTAILKYHYLFQFFPNITILLQITIPITTWAFNTFPGTHQLVEHPRHVTDVYVYACVFGGRGVDLWHLFDQYYLACTKPLMLSVYINIPATMMVSASWAVRMP